MQQSAAIVEKDCEEGSSDSDLADTINDEIQPLLSPIGTSRTYGGNSTLRSSCVMFGEDKHDIHTDHLGGVMDSMMYSTRKLTTWETFAIHRSTVWNNSGLWMMMLKLSGVAAAALIITVLVVPNPAVLKVAKFTQVSKFLNVVVGLLLGFFLSSSMNRWYSCVNGFLELMDAIRNLQMQFIALGVPADQTGLLLRYGFSSAWLIYAQLLLETKNGSEEKEARERMWVKLSQKSARFCPQAGTMILTKEEIETLKEVRDPPGMMWMWAAALIGRLAQDGWIPPMASPTYGRIMNLCQCAHGGIREVRAAISVQAPLMYTHMLSTLVHINNILNAVTFGIVSGIAIATTLAAHNMHIYKSPKVLHETATLKDSDQDLQNMAVTFAYCFFGPLLYQALLIISMHLAQPFDTDDAKIPMHKLLNQLEIDMCDGTKMLEHVPFEKPAFKQPPAASATSR